MFAFQELLSQNAFSEDMIINTVTEWRLKRGVSKAHMARQIGVERSYMTKLEKGRLQPSSGKMLRIAEYLEQPVEILFCVRSDA